MSVAVLRGKVFSLSPLSVKLAVGFSEMPSFGVREFLFNPSVLRVLFIYSIRSGCWFYDKLFLNLYRLSLLNKFVNMVNYMD